MSELGPTITELEPTATERLRALLTERGAEWRGGLPTETMVEADGLDLLYVALPDGRVRAFIRNYLTPEQAIEATLGDDLKAENSKLRELVRHLYTCLSFCDREDEERGCGFCPYRSASENCEFEQRLLELGVEV